MGIVLWRVDFHFKSCCRQTNSPTPMPSLTSTVQCCSQHALQKECWQGSASNESLLTTCRHTPQCRGWGAWRSNTPSNTARTAELITQNGQWIVAVQMLLSWKAHFYYTTSQFQGTCDCEPLLLSEIHNLITFLIFYKILFVTSTAEGMWQLAIICPFVGKK